MEYDCPSFYEQVFDTTLGRNLWDFINEPSTIEGMQDKSDQERPAVEFLEEKLPRRLKQAVARNSDVDSMKRMAGTMVKQVLEESGYRHLPYRRKVKPKGGLFGSGSLYERMKGPNP